MVTTTRQGDVPYGTDSVLSFDPRPPFLPRRERQLPAELVERFRRWLEAELGLARDARIAVVEWVSFDTRETPHVTMVTVMTGAQQLTFSVHKPLSAIERADLAVAGAGGRSPGVGVFGPGRAKAKPFRR